MDFILMVAVLLLVVTKGQGLKAENFTRTLVGAGSHRELKTEISLALDASYKKDSCSLVVSEDLPSSVFADKFQLHRFARLGRYEAAHVSGDLDVERPAFFSGPVTVELHVSCVAGKAEVSLPLHARYAPVSVESYYIVNLLSPSIALRCGKNLDQVDVPESTVLWPIPAGNPEHARMVNISTAIAAVAGTLVLSSVVLLSKRSSVNKS